MITTTLDKIVMTGHIVSAHIVETETKTNDLHYCLRIYTNEGITYEKDCGTESKGICKARDMLTGLMGEIRKGEPYIVLGETFVCYFD